MVHLFLTLTTGGTLLQFLLGMFLDTASNFFNKTYEKCAPFLNQTPPQPEAILPVLISSVLHAEGCYSKEV
jgi:hypothetical protein